MPWNQEQQPNFGSGLAAGATSGLKNFVMPEEEERQKTKLGMQMLSQRLGMEQSAKRQEQDYGEQLAEKLGTSKKIPEAQAISLASALGLDTKPLKGMGAMSTDALDSFMKSAAAIKGSQMHMQNTQQPAYDKLTGMPIGMDVYNIAGGFQKRINDPGVSAKVDEAHTLIDAEGDLENLKQRMKGMDFGRLQGLWNKAKGAVGMYPELQAFQSLVTDLNTERAKVVGGFKRFNDPEYQRFQDAAVKPISTPEEAANFVQNYQNLINVRKTTIGVGTMPGWINPRVAIMAHLNPPPKEDKPMPGFDFAAEDARRAQMSKPKAN